MQDNLEIDWLRLGEMSEVAAAVTFLASKDAAFINATDLKVY